MHEPEFVLCRPVGHELLHFAAPAMLYVPLLHVRQPPLNDALKRPAGQGWQTSPLRRGRACGTERRAHPVEQEQLLRGQSQRGRQQEADHLSLLSRH